MSWMSGRETSRGEDVAYSLLGLFDVNMPLLYGEGPEKAFLRLQQEIIKTTSDESIFVWTNNDLWSSGLLARSPAEFAKSGQISSAERTFDRPPCIFTNQGIEMPLPDLDSIPRNPRKTRPWDEISVPLKCFNKELLVVLHFRITSCDEYKTDIPIPGMRIQGESKELALTVNDRRYRMIRTHLDEIVNYEDPIQWQFDNPLLKIGRTGLGHQQCLFTNSRVRGRGTIAQEVHIKTRFGRPHQIYLAPFLSFKFGAGAKVSLHHILNMHSSEMKYCDADGSHEPPQADRDPVNDGCSGFLLGEFGLWCSLRAGFTHCLVLFGCICQPNRRPILEIWIATPNNTFNSDVHPSRSKSEYKLFQSFDSSRRWSTETGSGSRLWIHADLSLVPPYTFTVHVDVTENF